MSKRMAPLAALVAASLISCSGGSTSAPPPSSPHEPTTGTPAGAPADVAAPAAVGKTRTLDAETKITTASGATFTASAGWTVEERSDRVVLTSPEKDVAMAMFELKAKDRQAAVDAAWQQWKPGFALAVAQAVDLPGRDG